MKRAITYIFSSFAVLIALFLVLFVYLIYPDDNALPELNAADLPIKDPMVLVGSVLKNKLEHSIDIDDKAFANIINGADDLVETGMISRSVRFSSKYQVLAPLGLYPWRLEAVDALAVPSGHTLTVKVPNKADWLAFDLRDGVEAKVAVKQGDQASLFETTPPPRSFWPDFLKKNYQKYLYIHSYKNLRRWKPEWVSLRGAPTITFSCESTAGWCFVGDPHFYRADNKHTLRQNVFIIIDTLRSDALNASVMPRTEAFAKDAYRFEKAIAPGNMTSPSTNGVLACEPPTELGRVAFAYSISQKHREAFYGSGHKSFPALLQAQGLDTTMIGNISVVSEVMGAGVSHGFEHQLLTEPEGYETPLAIVEAERWLKEHRNQDFLLYIHMNNPHAPYRPPFRYLRSQFRDLADLTSYPGVVRWLYRGEAAFADAHVGRLIDFLKREGLYDNLNIVLTSDHGDQHTERPFRDNEIAQDFSGMFFDHGATLLNDEINVPLIIKPKRGGHGNEHRYVSSLWLGKTMLDLNEVSAKDSEKCAGLDLLHLPSNKGDFVTIGSEGFQARDVLFQDRYKYIKTYDPTEKRVYSSQWIGGIRKSYLKDEQLFDLAADPLELEDLTAKRPDLLETARQEFRTYFSLKSAYDLVLVSKKDTTFKVVGAPDQMTMTIDDDDLDPSHFKKGQGVLEGKFEGELHIRLSFRKMPRLPEVWIGDQKVPVGMTTLDLKTTLQPLPEETLRWTRERGEPYASLVYMLDERRKGHKISLGNPAFDAVLREWGYLNEN